MAKPLLKSQELLSKNSKVPEVFEFLDFRKYLLAFYEYRKAENPQFSYRTFARMVGMNSLNYLKMIISGNRNLSRTYARSLTRVCNLNADESRYFLSLVEWNQSKTEEDRLGNWQNVVNLAPKKKEF